VAGAGARDLSNEAQLKKTENEDDSVQRILVVVLVLVLEIPTHPTLATPMLPV
jgi:hypothetical protein